MVCFRPLQGYLLEFGDGSRKFMPNQNAASSWAARIHDADRIGVPCGQCLGCRLKKSRDWAVRCVHEASLYQSSWFLTLTYAPEHLPEDGSLDHSHFQLFMKRLRKVKGDGVRYFMCGEYGERFGRPHYHAILFNCDFLDRVVVSRKRGNYLWRSGELDSLWKLGGCYFGAVSYDSAAYVARYVTKKVTGEAADQHYRRVLQNGEEIRIRPEYCVPSRGSGIGKAWIERYMAEVYPEDEVLFKKVPCQPPRYYDKQLEIADPELFLRVKEKRKEKALEHADDQTPRRLMDAQICAQARFKQLVRSFEGEI